MNRMQNIGVRLNPITLQNLKNEATCRGITLGELAREKLSVAAAEWDPQFAIDVARMNTFISVLQQLIDSGQVCVPQKGE